MYGGDAYPEPGDIDNLIAAGLMNVQSQLIHNYKLEEISRDNVMQGPLVKVRDILHMKPLPDNFMILSCISYHHKLSRQEEIVLVNQI